MPKMRTIFRANVRGKRFYAILRRLIWSKMGVFGPFPLLWSLYIIAYQSIMRLSFNRRKFERCFLAPKTGRNAHQKPGQTQRKMQKKDRGEVQNFVSVSRFEPPSDIVSTPQK